MGKEQYQTRIGGMVSCVAYLIVGFFTFGVCYSFLMLSNFDQQEFVTFLQPYDNTHGYDISGEQFMLAAALYDKN
jgi:hypothetical protein